MKKFIAAAAGLMLAGTMTATAFAAVEATGDARVRYYYQDNYVNLMDSDDAHWNSRVRVKFKGTTESGAYAQARVNFHVSDWNGSNGDLGFDHAYLGVPMGPVVVEGGNIPTHLTAMLLNDSDLDSLQVKYADDMNNLVLVYHQISENDQTVGSTDEDAAGYWARYELTNDMINVVAVAGYINDETDADQSGFTGTIRVAQDFGAVFYSVDYAYVEEDLTGTVDAGHMAYAVLGIPTGEAGSISFVGALTDGGAVMDAPIGFTMLAGDQQITPSATGNLGQLAFVDVESGVDLVTGETLYENGSATVDTWALGLKASYQVGEKSTLSGTAAYANMENEDAGIDTSAWEIGAKYAYALAADTTLSVQLGYMDIDEFEDSQFGAGVNLDIKF